MDQERSASSRKSLNSEIGGEVEVVYFKLKVLKGQKAPWFCCPFYICERLYLPSCPFMEHLLAEKAAGAWPEEPWVLTGSEAFFGRFEICMTTMDTSVLTPQDVQTCCLFRQSRDRSPAIGQQHWPADAHWVSSRRRGLCSRSG
mmetsp:Transcript_36052/g.89918  ORF Transcript_36052/g.89918 Transcript_36052/m.89918 type:complete len:144 (+) Transcript_36052:48-479(+)